MQPSPIQLQELTYSVFSVKARSDFVLPPNQTGFDFNDVMIGESIEVNLLDNPNDPSSFAIHLVIEINNQEGKKAPYDLKIGVVGLFDVNKSAVKAEDRAELVEVNGCAMLYGAIRDLVLHLTSRSIHGALMLPTVNFLDRRKTN